MAALCIVVVECVELELVELVLVLVLVGGEVDAEVGEGSVAVVPGR